MHDAAASITLTYACNVGLRLVSLDTARMHNEISFIAVPVTCPIKTDIRLTLY